MALSNDRGVLHYGRHTQRLRADNESVGQWRGSTNLDGSRDP